MDDGLARFDRSEWSTNVTFVTIRSSLLTQCVLSPPYVIRYGTIDRGGRRDGKSGWEVAPDEKLTLGVHLTCCSMIVKSIWGFHVSSSLIQILQPCYDSRLNQISLSVLCL